MTATSPQVDVDAYLDRIGFAGDRTLNLKCLAQLQRRHLQAVPFENLDIALGDGVKLEAEASLTKIVDGGRGGWCFEVNGAFALLLDALGFDVRLLGAAVLLHGPTKAIDHLALEVRAGGQPYLVDVGFGESFISPLALNSADPQPGGNGAYQLIASPQGTTLTKLEEGVPKPLYRFKRVAHRLADFAEISASLQADPDKSWRTKPFATRLLGDGADRVTLSHDQLKFIRGGKEQVQPINAEDWHATLAEWFEIRLGQR